MTNQFANYYCVILLTQKLSNPYGVIIYFIRANEKLIKLIFKIDDSPRRDYS